LKKFTDFAWSGAKITAEIAASGGVLLANSTAGLTGSLYYHLVSKDEEVKSFVDNTYQRMNEQISTIWKTCGVDTNNNSLLEFSQKIFYMGEKQFVLAKEEIIEEKRN
jgi:hypothetical protein